MDDSGFARQLSDRARNAAMRNHNVVTIRSDFRQMLAETAQSVHKPPESRVSEPSSGHADGVSSQPPASVVAVAAPASSGAVASSNVNNNNNDTGSRKRTVTGPIEEPLYTRFALWASRRNPIVFRVGQFAMWCLRSAKRQLGATILLLVLLAALLIYPQYYALSPRTTLAAQIVAAALVGLALLVAVIGYAGHLASRNRDELRARLDAQERQVKSLDNRRTQNDLALRQFVDGGMGRLDEVSSRLDASIAHSDTALRKFVGAEIRRLEYEKDALAAEVRRLEAVSGESKNRSQADYDNSEVAIGKLHGELNRLGAAFAALAERDGSAKKQSADDVGRLQGELAALRSSVSANAADLAETQSVIAGFASEREVAARELQSLLSATAKRTDEVTAEFGREMEKRLNVAEESRRERMAAVTEQLGMIETRLTDRLADHRAQLDLRLSQMPEIDQIKLELFERLGALETEVKSSVANLPEDLDGRIASIRAEIERAMEARFSEVGGSASKELSGLRVEVEQRLGQIEASREERVEHVTDHLNSIEAKLTERLVALTSDIGEQLAELPATRDSARELMDRVAKVETDLVGNLEGASSQFEDAKAAIAKTLADELHAELARKVAEVEKSAMERVALGPVQLEAAKAGIIENLTRQLQAELARQMAAMEKSTQEKISQSPELLAGLDKQITDRMAAIQASIQEAANKAPADLEKIKAELAARISVVEKVAAEGVSKTDEKLKPLPEVQARTDQRIRQMEQLTRSASVYNISRFQRFNRTLRDPDIETLIADWSKPLGLDLNKARLGYLAHRCCQLESQMKGRFATTVEALVLRCLVASAPKRNQVSILEIGTLFGVGAAAVYEAARNQFDKVHLTVIDPLDGYYAEGNRDILTGENISEATLLQNWGQAQIPSGDFTVIKRLSNHSDAIESAAKREYDLLIIDGDHTYDGVKYDFDTYVGMVRPGGYVLFDDYDVEEWPDIKRYVDNEIESLPYLYRTGAGFRSAVFQVKKSPAKPKKKNKRG